MTTSPTLLPDELASLPTSWTCDYCGEQVVASNGALCYLARACPELRWRFRIVHYHPCLERIEAQECWRDRGVNVFSAPLRLFTGFTGIGELLDTLVVHRSSSPRNVTLVVPVEHIGDWLHVVCRLLIPPYERAWPHLDDHAGEDADPAYLFAWPRLVEIFLRRAPHVPSATPADGTNPTAAG